MSKNIAINGFGRIGKAFLRTIVKNENSVKELNVSCINIGPSDQKDLDIFFKYDSVLGTFDGTVEQKNDSLVINGHEIKILSEPDVTKIDWSKFDIDWVIDASGRFTKRDQAELHIKSGSKKILITAPATDEDVTIIPGVNDQAYDSEKHKIVSLGSCTTNCFAPIVKIIKDNFGLNQGFMTTVHAYTNNQALLDSEHKDPRRGRAAAINMIPTSTGADKVVVKIFPELKGKLKASSLRVPVPVVSIVDFTFTTEKEITKESLNSAFENASKNDLKNILCYETKPLVSSDFICSQYSCIFDSLLTEANGKMGKVSGWYDNEYGYSSRLTDFLLHNS